MPQPRSPYGIKGVGEIGLVPTAPAVAAALHDLDGRWRNTLPMKDAAAERLTRVFAAPECFVRGIPARNTRPAANTRVG